MNWNGDYGSGLLLHHQCLISQMLNGMNGQNFPQSGSDRGTNSIIMSMYLECSFITVPVGAMVRCPNTFVHIAYMYGCINNVYISMGVCIGQYMDACMYSMYGYIYVCMHVWMSLWINGRMDGQMDNIVQS